jgi:hypothetical protein
MSNRVIIHSSTDVVIDNDSLLGVLTGLEALLAEVRSIRKECSYLKRSLSNEDSFDQSIVVSSAAKKESASRETRPHRRLHVVGKTDK